MSPDAQSEDTHEVSGSESVGARENGKGSSERKFTSTLWQLGMWLCVHCTCCVCVCVLSGGRTPDYASGTTTQKSSNIGPSRMPQFY